MSGWKDPNITNLYWVMRHKRLRGPSKLCYWLLWNIAGRQPDYIFIDPAQVGLELGKDARCAKDWFEQLERESLVDIVDKQKSGWFIYVWSPNPHNRGKRPDPQPRFAFMENTEITARLIPDSEITAQLIPAGDNISPRVRCPDEEEDKLILFIKSVSWDQVKPLFYKVWKTIYHSRPGIVKNMLPAEEDRELILSACVLSLALKDGDKWLRYSAVAVKNQGQKARQPITLFRTCLMEKMVSYLGIGSEAEQKSQFGRLLRIVRSKANEFWCKLDQELEARKGNTTMREVNNPCNN